MEAKKVALISKDEISSWKSCQSITGNLAKAYLRILPETSTEFFKVTTGFNQYQAYKTAKKIFESEIELIIWLDHQPNAASLIEALGLVYEQTPMQNRPKFIIHLFGDFVLDCLGWKSVENKLKFWPVHFFVASERQKKLVDSFFVAKKCLVSVLPFPVDESIFNTDQLEENRIKLRERLGIGDGERVLLYTGRVSYQKNVEMLIKVFASIEPLFEGKLHLLIAGASDDLLMPYLGRHGLRGSFYAQFKNTLDATKKSKIKFLGQCETLELVELYQAADLFVSMSTHNDEDYGMSPAEALSCGLPSLLSNWGGYAAFKNYSDHVSLIDVDFHSFRPLPNTDSLRRHLIHQIMSPAINVSLKKDHSNKVKETLSIESVSRLLSKKIPVIDFGGVEDFSPAFIELCQKFKMHPHSPFKNMSDESRLSEIYKDIYDVYRV